MVHVKNLNDPIDQFVHRVSKAFRFLETTYGYSMYEPEKSPLPSEQIPVVDMVYLNDTVGLGIQVRWNRRDARILIAIIELDHGQIPEKYSPFYGHKGYARAISLSDLVAVVTDETVKVPLPDPPRPKSRYINKFYQQRRKRLQEDMEGVLQTYASWLQEYASDILHGETSIFPAVQRYSRKRLEQEYEAYGRAFPKEQYED